MMIYEPGNKIIIEKDRADQIEEVAEAIRQGYGLDNGRDVAFIDAMYKIREFPELWLHKGIYEVLYIAIYGKTTDGKVMVDPQTLPLITEMQHGLSILRMMDRHFHTYETAWEPLGRTNDEYLRELKLAMDEGRAFG